LRLSAASRSLTTRSGSLGIGVNEGGAAKINEATHRIVQSFFKSDAAAARKFLWAVEAVNVDGADDERLAWQEGVHDNLTPNARFIARDKSHGARRFSFNVSAHSADLHGFTPPAVETYYSLSLSADSVQSVYLRTD